jgi:23S rRNA (uracil1939-C5)-methyltransferase
MPAAVQQHWKARVVADALRQVPGIDPSSVEIEPLVPSPDDWHYRNKMEFTFGQESAGAPLKLGFHLPGNWKHILNVEKCWLQPDPLNRLLEAARLEGVRQRLDAWNPVMHQGMLRQLLIRWSVAEGRALVALLTGRARDLDFDAFRRAICDACPEVKGFIWGLNANRSDVARADEVIQTWGEDTLVERLGKLEFRVSLGSFFQTNTRGAEKLYQVAKDYLGLTGRERLLDAYCGTGTIGLFCADKAREVYGLELVREAVWDARENAARNGIKNATFMAGDMAATLPTLLGGIEGPIDRLVVDPPRSGMDKKALSALLEIRAPVLVYVSCNPTTMARDLTQIHEAGYRLDRLRPVDMFPQTYHIECVARCVLDSA